MVFDSGDLHFRSREQDLSVSPATPAPVIVVRDTIEGWRGFANSV
jgi:hypothetical protein